MSRAINILSYNVYLRPDPPFFDEQMERVRYLHSVLKKFDVCVLQEAFDNPSRKTLINSVSGTFPYRTIVAGRATGNKTNGGVMVFSKYPKIDQGVRLFGSHATGADKEANKGVRYVCIEKKNRRYQIFGTHLQAGDDTEREEIRYKQLAVLKAFIDSRQIPDTEPVLIAGDMNVKLKGPDRKYTDEFKKMLDTLDASIPKHEGPTTSTRSGARLDYVLYSNSHLKPKTAITRSRRFTYPGGELSDHYVIDSQWTFI